MAGKSSTPWRVVPRSTETGSVLILQNPARKNVAFGFGPVALDAADALLDHCESKWQPQGAKEIKPEPILSSSELTPALAAIRNFMRNQ